jgi:hypothetical protein
MRDEPTEPTPLATRNAAGFCTRCGLPWTYVDRRALPHARGHTCPPGYEEEEAREADRRAALRRQGGA